MRPADLTRRALVPLCVLVLCGCSLTRRGPTDAAGMPALESPTRTAHALVKERLALRELNDLWPREKHLAAAQTLDRRALLEAIRRPVGRTQSDEPDPIRGAFDSLPDGHRWMPDEFLPAGGTLDLTRLGRARLHLRAWNKDTHFRGGGLGATTPLRSGWHASAELGVDPARRPDAGGLAVVVGLGFRR